MKSVDQKALFIEKMHEIADKSKDIAIRSKDPVITGTYMYKMMNAFWFRDHFPVIYNQLQVYIDKLNRDLVEAIKRKSDSRYTIIEAIEDAQNLYIYQEDFLKED